MSGRVYEKSVEAWMTIFNVNRWKVQQVGSHLSCTSLYYVPPRYTKKARWPMLCKFSRWGKKSCNSYINGLWLDQSVKNRLHTRSPSSNRGGKVSPKCTLHPPKHAMRVASVECNLSTFSLPASCCVCHHLILGRKNQAWCVYRSLTCGQDELHACLPPTIVHSTMVHTFILYGTPNKGTLGYGTLCFHR